MSSRSAVLSTRWIQAHPMQIRGAVRWVVGAVPAHFDLFRLDLGLTEALTNAVVHGALELQLPTAYDPADLPRLAEERAKEPAYCDRRVGIECMFTQSQVTLVLRWKGAPYRPTVSAPVRSRLPAVNGRGTTVILNCFDEVTWSSDGLSGTFKLNHWSG